MARRLAVVGMTYFRDSVRWNATMDQIDGWGAIVGSVSLMLPFAFAHYRNMHKWPLTGRMPKVILLQDLVVFLYMVGYYAPYTLYPLPCGITVWLNTMLLHMYAWLYIYRIAKLLFQFELTAAMADMGNMVDKADSMAVQNSPNWFVRHCHWVGAPFVRRVGVGLLFYGMSVPIVVTCLPGLLSPKPCADSIRFWFYLTMLQWFLYVLFIMVMACRIRRHQDDGFFIKRELRYTLLLLAFFA
eukprot:g6959.t1